jgi:hypothetical protein
MLIVFFDNEEIFHNFIPLGPTVNQKLEVGVLWHLRKDVRRKCPDMWHTQNWLLHHDMSADIALFNKLCQNPHDVAPTLTPYDLPPCDFLLFPKTKIQLKG